MNIKLDWILITLFYFFAAFLLAGAIRQAYPTALDVPCLLAEDQCVKWDHKNLTFTIENHTKDQLKAELAYDALKMWEYKTGGLFTFSEVTKNPDIKILIEQKVGQTCGSAAAGCTYLKTNGWKVENTTIRLSLESCSFLSSGGLTLCAPVTTQTFWIAAQHEVGHSLGLSHAVGEDGKQPLDIMGGKIRDGMQITQQDLDKLRWIYHH